MPVRIALYQTQFGEKEKPLCETGEITVWGFRYDSGVAALRIGNARGEVIMLPFQGSQIWRAAFDGRDLTMRSMFEEPRSTRVYLETYGGFLSHCGLAGLGAPGPKDTHVLHGELPNAPMQMAWLEADADRVTVVATYHHTVAFSTNYIATVSTSIATGAALMDVSVMVENLKSTPMDVMYLAHANFAPVDHGELHYSADYTAQSVRVRRSIPAHITPKPGYAAFLEELAENPTLSHVLEPALAFDPEVVFEIDMKADTDCRAHALQKHPDGYADYIRFSPEQAPLCMRWICRTPDQDGLGLAFPATAGVEGYAAEKAKGRGVELAGHDSWRIDMTIGHLTTSETDEVIARIDAIRAA
ncbi:MAG: DUF4432 family protein [Pseudomonadota bacterium]